MAPQPTASESSAVPLLDRVWRERPYAPRAVALLLYFLDNAEVVDRQATSDAELAAGMLADSLRVRRAFEAVYGLPWQACQDTFATVTEHSVEHPTLGPGDEVVYVTAVRMLRRLGYIDGVTGAIEAPTLPGEAPKEAPAAGSDAEALAMSRAAAVVGDVLSPAYQDGRAAGTAERTLEETEPGLKEALTLQAIEMRGAPPDEVSDALAELVDRHIEPYDESAREPATVYANLLADWLLEVRARRDLHDKLQGESPVAPMATAAVLAVLARERDRPEAEFERHQLDREFEEAVLLAATQGFAPEAVAALIADERTRSPMEVVTGTSRNMYRGLTARELVLALSDAPPHGSIGPSEEALFEPAHPLSVAPVHDVADEASFEALMQTLRSGLCSRPEYRDLLDFQRTLAARGTDPRTEALLLTDRVLQWTSMDALPNPSRRLAAYARAEAGAQGEAVETVWDRLERALQRHRAFELADALLAADDESGRDRVRAEAEIIRVDRPLAQEQGERWVRAYRAEAARLGASVVDLPFEHAVRRDGEVAEGLRLLARARILEGTLDALAAEEAGEIVSLHVPVIGQEVYAGEDAEDTVASVYRVAAHPCREMADRRSDAQPAYGARVRSYLPSALMAELLTELELIREYHAEAR